MEILAAKKPTTDVQEFKNLGIRNEEESKSKHLNTQRKTMSKFIEKLKCSTINGKKNKSLSKNQKKNPQKHNRSKNSDFAQKRTT
jgi:hypothetical protein